MLFNDKLYKLMHEELTFLISIPADTARVVRASQIIAAQITEKMKRKKHLQYCSRRLKKVVTGKGLTYIVY